MPRQSVAWQLTDDTKRADACLSRFLSFRFHLNVITPAGFFLSKG
jgi:hypothetical protein